MLGIPLVSEAAVVTGLSPSTGTVGATVTITGTALLGATGVTFTGPVTVTPTAVAATSVRAVVPPAALTGPVSVITPTGTATSTALFRVAPRITGFAPSAGLAGESVTVTGWNLLSGNASAIVQVGTIAAGVTSASPTSLTLQIPTTAATGRIIVRTADGTATSATDLVVIRPPLVASFAPASGPVGAVVTVTGSNLLGVTEVTFNGTPATDLVVISNTSLRATVPAGATSGRLVVTNRAGSGQSPGLFKVLPRITGFSPASVIAGESVTVSGFNLLGVNASAMARIGTVAVAVTSASATELTFAVPPTAVTGPIAVTTPDGTATSATSLLVIRQPVITSLVPAAGPVGTIVTVSGTNLAGVTAATFNGTPASTLTVLSNTSLRATVAEGATTGRISLTNRAGVGQSAGVFKVLPKITSFDPPGGIAGESVTVRGFNLLAGNVSTIALVGTVAVPVTAATPTEVSFTIPTTAFSGRISLRTADGTAVSTATLAVTRPPVVSSLAPASAVVGTVVTVTGTNLLGVTSVQFNGTPASVFTVVSNTSLKATVPTGATTGRVVLTNRAGPGQSVAPFKVLPKVTGFTPASGIAGESVTVTGLNLAIGSVPPTVRVGAVVAVVTQSTPTSVTFVIPPTAVTGRINVVTTDGTAASPTNLVVIRIPTVSSFTPAAGPPGTVVTVNGSNLAAATGVSFNGTAASAMTVVSATSLKAAVPAGATTGRITVINRAGSAQSAGTFKVAPLITEFSPQIGVPTEPVTLRGFNLKLGTAMPTVKVGSIAAVVTDAAPTSVTFLIPATTAKGRITLTTTDGVATTATELIVLVAGHPQPASFQPTAGPVGTTVVITGTDLSLGSEVAFGGSVKATPTAVTPTSMRVVVPSGAQSGPLTVKNPKGTGTTATAFTVLPRITEVTPHIAVAGQSITITGTALKVGGDLPVVKVGGVSAPVDSSTTTTVVARVPSGAATGRVTITTVDGTAISPSDLMVSPVPIVESRLEKTTSRLGTVVERVVEVRFRPSPADFHSVIVTDGVLFLDTPLALNGQLVDNGRPVEDFSLRRVLADNEAYPAADREFTVVATPAAGGATLTFRVTPQTLGGVDHLTIVDVQSPRVTTAPTILSPIVAGTSTLVGVVQESNGTVVEVFGCLGGGCAFTSLGTAVVSGPFWFLTPPAPLAAGDRLRARATAPGKVAGLNSSTVTVLATGQLAPPTVVSPIPAGATNLVGLMPADSIVEVFVRSPQETSLGIATGSGVTWSLEGLSPLLPGQEVFAIGRRSGLADSPPSESVVVAAAVPLGHLNFQAVANAPLAVTWDIRGITAPITVLRLMADVGNADETLVCQGEDEVEGAQASQVTRAQVNLPLTCTGVSGAQATTNGRVCIGVIDNAARLSSHCIVFD